MQGPGRPQLPVKLRIISDPPLCQVFIDDRLLDKTNDRGILEKPVPKARYKVRVTCEGYQEEEKAVDLTKLPRLTKEWEERFKLAPLFVDLEVQTSPPEPDVEISLDGTSRGFTKAGGRFKIERVQAGEHRIQGRRKGFQSSREQLVKVLPDNSSFTIEFPPDPVRPHIDAIDRELAEGRLSQAFDIYEKAAREYQGHTDLPSIPNILIQKLDARSQQLLSSAGVFGFKLNVDQAEGLRRLYERAQRLRPDDQTITLYLHLYALEYYSGKAAQTAEASERDAFLQNSRQELENISRLKPLSTINSPHILYDLGWHYFTLNNYGAAEEYFSKASSMQPSWGYPRYAVARLHLEQAEQESDKKKRRDKYEPVIRELTEVIGAGPTDALAYAHADRAAAYAALGKEREAIDDGQKATALASDSAYAHYALGLAYYHKGKKEFPKARAELEAAKSLTLDPLDARRRKLAEQMLAKISEGKK